MSCGSSQEALLQPELVEQVDRRRVNGVAAEVAEEVGVLLEHDHLDAGARQQEREHEPGRTTAHDAALCLQELRCHPLASRLRRESRATLPSMNAALLTIGSILIFLAAAFHIYVFFLESITWRTPKTWKTFGLPSQEHADIIRPMAFNQGFYNLFLALGAVVGIALLGVAGTVAVTLMVFAALCMVGAGVVLFFSIPASRRAALIQAGPPLFGVLFVLLAL